MAMMSHVKPIFLLLGSLFLLPVLLGVPIEFQNCENKNGSYYAAVGLFDHSSNSDSTVNLFAYSYTWKSIPVRKAFVFITVKENKKILVRRLCDVTDCDTDGEIKGDFLLRLSSVRVYSDKDITYSLYLGTKQTHKPQIIFMCTRFKLKPLPP